ncbi:MAG: hypothetical protein Q7T29_10800 [Gallionella sp.]|nr:hypothetical protein [Gallionella sp.]
MSQPSIPHNNTNRRNFLTLALATAAIVPISESALARDRHRHGKVATARSDKQKNALRDQKTLQTAMALRDLWLGHIFWVRNVSLAAIDKNDSSMKAAEQQAVANAQSIAASIEPFYGAGAKDGFFKLLAGHYGAVKAYLVANLAGDASAQAKATQAIASNAEEIATYLSKANPYLPKDALQGLLLAHGGHHIQQIQQLKDRKYEAEAQTWEEMKKHVYQIADATADALAKQFVKRFS